MGIEQLLELLESRLGLCILPSRKRRKFAGQRVSAEPLERRNLLAASSLSVTRQAFDATSPVETQDGIVFALNSPENNVNHSAGTNDSLSAEVSRQTDVATELQPELIAHADGVTFEGIQPTIQVSSLITSFDPHFTTSAIYENAIPEYSLAVRNSDIQFGQLVGTEEFSMPATGIQLEQNIENIELISLGQASSHSVLSGMAGTRVFIGVIHGLEVVELVQGTRIDGNNRTPATASHRVTTTDTEMVAGPHLSMNVAFGELNPNGNAVTAYGSPKAWQLTAGKTASRHTDMAAYSNSWGQTRPSIVTGNGRLLSETNKSYSHATRRTSATYRHAFRCSPLSATRREELETLAAAHRLLGVHLGDPIGRLSALSSSNLLGEFYDAGGNTIVADSWLSNALAAVSHSSSKAAFTVSVLGVLAWVSWWPVERQMRSDRRTVIGTPRILDDTVRAVRLTS